MPSLFYCQLIHMRPWFCARPPEFSRGSRKPEAPGVIMRRSLEIGKETTVHSSAITCKKTAPQPTVTKGGYRYGLEERYWSTDFLADHGTPNEGFLVSAGKLSFENHFVPTATPLCGYHNLHASHFEYSPTTKRSKVGGAFPIHFNLKTV